MSLLAQTEETLKHQIKDSVLQAGLANEDEMPEVVLEKPKDKNHGDFATNIAMQLARVAKKAPRQIAEEMVNHFNQAEASVEKVEIAGPGFINFFMKEDFLGSIVQNILKDGSAYGRSQAGNNERVQVEFVSVNPTGDLHLGHARGAAFGDVLCNVLDAAGYQVEREYYINDAGNQIDNLALSVEARYLQALGQEATLPEDGYHGEDIAEIGKQLSQEYGDEWAQKDREERLAFFKEYGLSYELGKIKKDLQAFGVHFDSWFSERSLYKENKIVETLGKIAAYTYEKDGATWFRSTEFGDDKDRVLIKQDGSYTYLTPDIAYHKNKLDRGFNQIINVWGADHHGYIPRMRAAIQALGYPVEKFAVKIIQMVNLFENGEKVRMSKRTGKAVALRELMEEVGVDAVRYYFVMRSNDSQLDFDMDLARSESNDNPVFYVQYAHARICTMLKQAEAKGFSVDSKADVSLLTTEKESDLLKKLAAFPQVIADAAIKQTPHKVTQYVFDLASLLHSFYNAEKVLDMDHTERTKARIALMQAVKITLANALRVIGVSAPEKM
ncbi:arginine--tRNA ligase [Virgibacillus pantothenticus]|uniref:Arginine--tRNA ligase n=1 Tax=Virgibacillus pantothenticus TaxID=1473 RepID=A0A0L0QS59_VIRPA|nr:MULTISPECIES: arginine--tRNA ligase [Virgibacillus]API91856.1 arginine--tRNA ligase [Virgibacillus sp. 6R]KNE21505.1 arginine--tRNA ligase [Virgibacillus pantothenticus]MBS7430300.1 arginine--tRNA ligase [Virgibacillus sp. 19R1-5]MBU8566519.1 arginine--tRNA ligase [Virgibacillus pantothenticus]MBU8599011.1 arginine--tRNA ligase [Virgibacillus pantothenticus]